MPPRSVILALFAATILTAQSPPATFTITGDWDVRIALPNASAQTIHVTPPTMVEAKNERYASLPVFNPKASGWTKGVQLNGVKAQETTSPHMLDASSFTLRAGPEPEAAVLKPGIDYELEPVWGTLGRLESGQIKPDQPVFASYRYAQMRLDRVVLTSAKQIMVRTGEPRVVAPAAPALQPGDQSLGNIYLSGAPTKLGPECLFPILETTFPAPPPSTNPVIAKWEQRLKAGEPVRILAWGDSVTDAVYLPDPTKQRWQEQFVARLRARFPKAKIELLTQAWGGRNTATYLAEPPGSPHNYRETVLALKPNLIISEFVNDANLSPDQVEERYSKLLADFQSIGADWIILTPHYVRPDWMHLTQERDIDNDPRPYVAGLRQFAAKHNVPLADASLRWGHLWREGIPYSTLLLNAINHPNADGMRLFADSLMALFP